MVRGYVLCAQPLPELEGDALDHPSRVYKNERRAMRACILGDPVVDLIPKRVAGYGAEWGFRNLNCQIHCAALATFDDSDRIAMRAA